MSNQITPNPSVPTQIVQELKFPQYINNLGIIPTSYKDSMSYSETLAWFCKYLENTVIPTLNQNGQAVQELQGLYIELKSYVDNYFTNLDVQDEIDKKLDEMVENGTISDILSNYFHELEVDYDQKYENIQDNINTQIAQLNTKIEALGDIGPIPVSSVSNMTDHDKIYLNVTNGEWYYYDGTQFTSGGIYQSSQNLSDLEGLIEAFQSYNIKGIFDFSVGNVGTTTGEVITNYQRIYTTNIISAPYSIYIDKSTYVQTNLYFYNNDNSFNKAWENSQNASKGCYIPAGQKFRISCFYVTPPDPIPSLIDTDPKESNLYIALKMYKYSDYKEMQLQSLRSQSLNINTSDLKYNYDFFIGDYGSANGLSETPGSFKRILTWYVLKFDKDIRIKSKISAQSYIWYYDDVAGTNPSGQGWKDIYNSEVVIPAGQCFRFVTSYSSTYAEALYDVYNNDVFKNLIFETVEEITPPNYTNPNIHYIRSIAHQGYSSVDHINYCKLEGYQNAKDYGFDYGELDIRMTSDNVLVCSHDDTFESGGETITISENTYSDLAELDYHGGQLATFESIIALCKQVGLGVYIDHLYTLNNTGWGLMFEIIKKYQMQDNVVFLCNTNQAQITRVLNFNYKAEILIVTESTNVESIVALINANKTNFNKFSIDTNHVNYSIESLNSLVDGLPSDVHVEVWTIDNVNTFKQFMPYVSGITSNDYSIMQILENIDD